jgi:YHS domain-containing protein
MRALFRHLAMILIASCCGVALAQSSASEPRLALRGYDPVAYFTDNKPVKGDPRYQHDFDGTRYQFASAQHRSQFEADPDRYAPQFSGLCSAAIAGGQKKEGDPNVWKIVDGKLYVFSKAGPWVEDPAVIPKAQARWKETK